MAQLEGVLAKGPAKHFAERRLRISVVEFRLYYLRVFRLATMNASECVGGDRVLLLGPRVGEPARQGDWFDKAQISDDERL